jgi:hypothetical protein
MKSKGKSRYNSRVGRFLFFVPAIIIVILVVYAYIQLNSPGTLIISAEDANGNQLKVHATVNGNTVTTPTKLPLSQGSYTVDFATVTWYYPPASRNVAVDPGQTVYAVGFYQPETVFVQVTPAGFNVTTIAALHAVTPVKMINPTNSFVQISGGPFPNVGLNPGQTYTYMFPTAGTFEFNEYSGNVTLTVTVQ